MLEGLYSAAAGLTAQQRRLDAIANDVANVSTTGYKRVRVGFRDLVYREAGLGAGAGVATGNGAAATVVGRGFSQGPLRETERPLDLAISGPGFFRVRRPDGGIGLTRDGAFRAGPDGRLLAPDGSPLEPPLTLPRGTADEDVEVAPDGVVTAADRRVGRIEVVTVAAPDGLQAVGGSVFLPTAASGAPVAAPGSRIVQSSLEASNVDMADALVDMMDAQRSFALASRAVSMQDEVMGIANGIRR